LETVVTGPGSGVIAAADVPAGAVYESDTDVLSPPGPLAPKSTVVEAKLY